MREEGRDRWNSGFRLCAALSSSVRIAAQEQRFRLSLRRLITWWRFRNTHVPAGRTREEAENLRISAPTDGWKECSARVPTARAEDRALDSKRDAKRASREGRTRRGGGGRRGLRELPNFRPRTHARGLVTGRHGGVTGQHAASGSPTCLNRKPSASAKRDPRPP